MFPVSDDSDSEEQYANLIFGLFILKQCLSSFSKFSEIFCNGSSQTKDFQETSDKRSSAVLNNFSVINVKII